MGYVKLYNILLENAQVTGFKPQRCTLPDETWCRATHVWACHDVAWHGMAGSWHEFAWLAMTCNQHSYILPTDEKLLAQGRLADALRLCADRDNLPLLVHCIHGETCQTLHAMLRYQHA